MKNLILIFLIAVIGAGCASVSEQSTDWHWGKIKEHRAYIDDPENQKPDSNGFIYTDAPDIMPSLYALVKAGEIIHLDLVFPNV